MVIRLKYWLVLVLILGGGCAPAREPAEPAATNGSHFYFIQMTDTHWGAKDGIAMTRSAVELINRLPVKVEFVAITGDLFSDSIRNEQIVREGVAVLKGLKIPVYCIPGNHDLAPDNFRQTQSIFEENFGPTEQKLTVKGVTCLFLCTEMSSGEKRSAWQVERAAIEKEIGTTIDPVLIFMHRPPLRDVLGNDDKETDPLGDVTDSRWTLLFSQRPAIKAVFAGHFHRDEMMWIGAVPVYIAPALARFWDRQPAFRLYEYRNGQINYWTLYPERPPKR